MSLPSKLVQWLSRALWGFGLITVLVIATPLVSWWGRLYSGPLERPKGDILILLSAARDDNGGISYSSYWRARYALLAWQTGGFKKIIVSGGGPGISNFLMAEGIPRDVIEAEWRSPSTHESGMAVAHLVQNLPGRKVLITSDYHMYRAVRVFRKCGVAVEPMPVPDVLQSAEHWSGRFPAFETMLVESVKIVYYSVRGWI
ncbi:MAG: YdcF family protein [Terracidiphilus sp.]